MKPRVASLFCGIGGLDVGFEAAGAEISWAADLCPIATASYPLNFSRRAHQVDLATFNIDEIPNTDLIIGGPPCQSFSLVGRRMSDDSRGKLVFRFLDIVREKRPLGFLMENVPGLAAARIDGVRLTDHLAEEFSRLGYHVAVFKLNAADYLVPQLRKRVFIVGSLQRAISRPDPREFANSAYGIDASEYDLGALAAIGDLGDPVERGKLARYSDVPPSQFARLMRRRAGNQFSLHGTPRMSETDRRLVRVIPPGGNYMDVPDHLATQRILNFKRTGGRTSTYGRLHPNKPSFTLNTYFRRPNVGANFHPVADRLITVREAMRLQSIPDHFQIAPGGAQDNRNALVGNAVPPLLAQAIARELLRSVDALSINNPVELQSVAA